MTSGFFKGVSQDKGVLDTRGNAAACYKDHKGVLICGAEDVLQRKKDWLRGKLMGSMHRSKGHVLQRKKTLVL